MVHLSHVSTGSRRQYLACGLQAVDKRCRGVGVSDPGQWWSSSSCVRSPVLDPAEHHNGYERVSSVSDGTLDRLPQELKRQRGTGDSPNGSTGVHSPASSKAQSPAQSIGMRTPMSSPLSGARGRSVPRCDRHADTTEAAASYPAAALLLALTRGGCRVSLGKPAQEAVAATPSFRVPPPVTIVEPDTSTPDLRRSKVDKLRMKIAEVRRGAAVAWCCAGC